MNQTSSSTALCVGRQDGSTAAGRQGGTFIGTEQGPWRGTPPWLSTVGKQPAVRHLAPPSAVRQPVPGTGRAAADAEGGPTLPYVSTSDSQASALSAFHSLTHTAKAMRDSAYRSWSQRRAGGKLRRGRPAQHSLLLPPGRQWAGAGAEAPAGMARARPAAAAREGSMTGSPAFMLAPCHIPLASAPPNLLPQAPLHLLLHLCGRGVGILEVAVVQPPLAREGVRSYEQHRGGVVRCQEAAGARQCLAGEHHGGRQLDDLREREAA